ncbi:OmpA/MotB family protein [Kushneria indalinina]|uniref:Chemotaxis protein MotB n=1 Tax=Kushneria indalinina DSM 14324 TaxID=1122140 RepID=A0A3D9DWD5_9GAMM|nr:OmpA family protein [Kushneria indalinina]REC95082.1 chemotaxis protein MotB [Kushneria indalinina DSM 14324]
MEHRSSGASGQARQAARELVLTADRSEESDGWMLSYLDLLTLLLVLFVLLLAMRGVVPQDDLPAPASPMASEAVAVMVSPLALAAVDRISPVQAIPVSTTGVLSSLMGSPTPQTPWQMLPATPVIEDKTPARVDVQAALAVMTPLTQVPAPAEETSQAPADEVMAMDHRLAGIDGVQVTRERERTILRIEDRLLFPSADVDIGTQGNGLLDRLLPALRDFDGEISVEGHTDSRTISTAQFPSNWELSAGRATAVLRYLSRGGVSSTQLRAIGYGPTRPLAGNDTETGRAQNRRVELVLSPAGPRSTTP